MVVVLVTGCVVASKGLVCEACREFPLVIYDTTDVKGDPMVTIFND